MGKYVDGSGLSHFMGIIKGYFAAKGEAISNITRSGTTFTATKADGTSFTFTQQDNTVSKTTTTPKMDGTAAVGTETKYAAGDHVHPSDTSRVPTTRTVNGKALSADITLYGDDIKITSSDTANIADMLDELNDELGNKVDKVTGKGLSTNDYTTDEKNKLAGINAGAEVNQNAFSNVKVGTTTVAADSKTDTLELVAGTNITLTADATNDKVTIATSAEVNQNAFSNVKVGSTTIAADAKQDTLELVASTNVTLTTDATNDKVTIASADTKNTAGSTDSSSKLFLVGAASQAANPQTYSHDTAYVDTNGHLYSNSKQVVNLSDAQALTNKTYNGLSLTAAATGFTVSGGTTSKTLTVNNSYTLGAACAKGVDTSIASGSTSTNLPTTAAVVNYIGEVAGALVYKGTASAEGDLLNTALKTGWFYIVDTAGSYGGNTCEAGDMIIVNTGGTYTTSTALGAAIDVVQTNIEVLSNSEIDALWTAA